jgi:hypothetical protein
MITAALVRVSTEEDLERGNTVFRLGFKLPTGDIVYADVSPDVVLNLRNMETTAPPGEVPTRLPLVAESPESPPFSEVEWRRLPAGLLPDAIKEAMSSLPDPLPDTLPLEQVLSIRDILIEHAVSSTQTSAASVRNNLEGPISPTVSAGVEWSPGTTQEPMVLGNTQSIPIDSAGNPLVPQRGSLQAAAVTVDPGEVATEADDTEQW